MNPLIQAAASDIVAKTYRSLTETTEPRTSSFAFSPEFTVIGSSFGHVTTSITAAPSLSDDYYVVKLTETYLVGKFSEIKESRVFYEDDCIIVELKMDMDIPLKNEREIIAIESKLIKTMHEKEGIDIDFRHYLV